MTRTERKEVKFSREQYQYLLDMFPDAVLGFNVPETQLRHYMGQRSVLAAVKERAYGAETTVQVLPTRG